MPQCEWTGQVQQKVVKFCVHAKTVATYILCMPSHLYLYYPFIDDQVGVTLGFSLVIAKVFLFRISCNPEVA